MPLTDDPLQPIDGEAPGTLPWLVAIMQRLLAPDGCPWDREQTLESLRPFLLEEAYEVLDALDEGDPEHHGEELGDLLFQIVFQAQLAGQPMKGVIEGIGRKLIRRHPHVFGEVKVESSQQVLVNWEQIKTEERGRPRGLLEGVPQTMPALQRAHRLTYKAAKVGFDWPDLAAVREKVSEELGELDEAAAGDQRAAIDHELGDLLLAVVNWARKLDLDPEESLRRANRRFERRFAHVEAGLARAGKTPSQSSLEEMDQLWNEAKVQEREDDDGSKRRH
jgi:nucleoside triphosphate diphosphatase